MSASNHTDQYNNCLRAKQLDALKQKQLKADIFDVLLFDPDTQKHYHVEYFFGPGTNKYEKSSVKKSRRRKIKGSIEK